MDPSASTSARHLPAADGADFPRSAISANQRVTTGSPAGRSPTALPRRFSRDSRTERSRRWGEGDSAAPCLLFFFPTSSGTPRPFTGGRGLPCSVILSQAWISPRAARARRLWETRAPPSTARASTWASSAEEETLAPGLHTSPSSAPRPLARHGQSTRLPRQPHSHSADVVGTSPSGSVTPDSRPSATSRGLRFSSGGPPYGPSSHHPA